MSVRWSALACDYDGTLKNRGRRRPATLEALCRLRCSRRKLLLVTGRELNELFAVFPSISLFDRVVAENGAVICDGKLKGLRHWLSLAADSCEGVNGVEHAPLQPLMRPLLSQSQTSTASREGRRFFQEALDRKDSPEFADKVRQVSSIDCRLRRYLRRPVGTKKQPRCAIAVKPIVSVFKIAVKREELLLAKWKCNRTETGSLTDSS